MKVALIADLHIGVKRDDPVFYESQRRFFTDQLVPELNASGVGDIWIEGDCFDTRQSISLLAINRTIDLFKNILNGFRIRVIVGNHDMFYSTDLGVNSLKILSLLPNVTVYEKPETVEIDGKRILFRPWITNYADENILNGSWDYAFMHADIVGFDQGGGRPSEAGLKAAYVLDHVRTTFSGHYHCMDTREYSDGKSITYIGAPYQITRIDRDGRRGYHLLDIGTGETEFVENRVSIRFTRHTYPEADESAVPGNVVDLDVPAEYYDQTKKVAQYVQRLEKLGPAYPVNVNYVSAEQEEADIDTADLNLVNLFTGYLEQYETAVDKKKIYDGFMELYNIYKEQA